jgi:dTDP-4-dehydrorhamnose 3,5-epimerase
MSEWLLQGVKDAQLVKPDWEPSEPVKIEGVVVKAIANVLTDNGCLTEIYRQDWRLDDKPVAQVFQKWLSPGGLSAWHMHRITVDRLFVGAGRAKVVLFDGRKHSPTVGAIQEFRLGIERPALIVVPPGVWHGVKALAGQPALIINAVDQAYDYEDPDHWRLPADTLDIPYRIV